jgi:hypothetical protein
VVVGNGNVDALKPDHQIKGLDITKEAPTPEDVEEKDEDEEVLEQPDFLLDFAQPSTASMETDETPPSSASSSNKALEAPEEKEAADAPAPMIQDMQITDNEVETETEDITLQEATEPDPLHKEETKREIRSLGFHQNFEDTYSMTIQVKH